jgi:hypothetical protein
MRQPYGDRSAEAVSREGILTLLEDYWRVPRPLVNVTLAAIRKASCPRAMTLKYHLALTVTADLDYTFRAVVTPALCVELIEDLVGEQLLTRAQAAVIENGILHCTSRVGAWRDV